MAVDFAVKLEHVTVKRGGQIILEDVSLQWDTGAFVAVIGPNGGGKTTLIRTLLGLQAPSAGKVELLGATPLRTRHRVGYVPQLRPIDLSFPISVAEVVAMGCLSHQHSKAKHAEHVQNAMQQLELSSLAKRPVGTLSGGELQRTLIARALAADPQMLVLDEPTSHIDPKATELIYQILTQLNQRIPIITVSHELGVVSQFIKTIACVNRCVHDHGTKEMTPSMFEETYGCPVDLIAHGTLPHRVLSKHIGHSHD